ncbi:MAG TPA: hypothetical protein VFN57_17640 [Thermomicrobiaceae bacterium]|nr:hypothetical protein [Thermomicrobiaceae bacterium]
MQNRVRYNVINQDGRPVIRAVPVSPRAVGAASQAAARAIREQSAQHQELAQAVRASANDGR